MGRRPWIALALLLPVPSLGVAASMYWWPGTPLGKALFIAGKIWLLLLPTLWWLLIERRRWSWSPPVRGGFGVATLLGAVLGVMVLGAYWAAHQGGWIDVDEVTDRAALTGLNRLDVYLAGALYWITLNSLLEEYVWRWFVFDQFESLYGSRVAVLGSALGFTAHHVLALAGQFDAWITLAGSIGVFAGGVTWSWLYLRYRSIWPCYVSHAIVDVVVFAIGYALIFARHGA
jgi:uncharacterized protein